MNWTDDIAAEVKKVARARRRPYPQEIRRRFGPLFKDLPKTMRFHHDKMIRDLLNLCEFLPKKALGVEIGSFAGESALLFMLSGKVGHLACVDPWNTDYYRDNRIALAEASFDRVQAAMPGKISKHKLTGLEFLEARSESKVKLDFIYVDGDHSFECCRGEIQRSTSLIKPGGIICGHDYGYRKSPGVERAVKEVFGNADVLFAGYSWIVFADRLQTADPGVKPIDGK